jgi:hypothetical protein
VVPIEALKVLRQFAEKLRMDTHEYMCKDSLGWEAKTQSTTYIITNYDHNAVSLFFFTTYVPSCYIAQP